MCHAGNLDDPGSDLGLNIPPLYDAPLWVGQNKFKMGYYMA